MVFAVQAQRLSLSHPRATTWNRLLTHTRTLAYLASNAIAQIGHHAKLFKPLTPLVWWTLATGAVHAAQPLIEEDQPEKPASLSYLSWSEDTKSTYQQRFLQAQKAIAHNKLSEFHALRPQLIDYPLLPYLDYRELSKRLAALPYRDVDNFLYDNANTYLADRLRRDWLYTLERKKHWHELQSYYSADLNDRALTCHYLRARLLTGDENALQEVGEVWNQGFSLPKACDPLFTLWANAGGQTAALSWSRATKAIENRKLQLVRYITKRAPADIKPALDLLLSVDRNPHQLQHTQRFASQTPEMQFTIMHGLQRLARLDPLKAATLWQSYDAQQLFPDQQRRTTQAYLIKSLARKDHTAEAYKLATQVTANADSEMINQLVRSALDDQDWSAVNRWIATLPDAERTTPRWQYWATRAAEAQGHQLPPYPSIEASYRALAQGRSFYGFLAADRLGLAYALEDQPSQVPLVDQALVQNNAGIARAKAFYDIGSLGLARAEWYYTSKQLNASQLQAAGTLAYHWGWHRKGIQAMIEARAWNDLTVRFPLAYAEQMEAQARQQSMDANLLFAIARQESAFAEDARSSAGALGLMQLMPATAKQTASKAGMRYQQRDLLKPEFNIALGSRYLNEMLGRYEGNPAFAAAAYNAGPHRVDRWLDEGRDQLPLDIWIETIPFTETRNYVQNVMVFSVIYAYRNGADVRSLRGATGLIANPTSTVPASSTGAL